MTPTLWKQMVNGVQGQILPDSSPFIITVGNFNLPLSFLDMASELKVNKNSELKYTTDLMN